MYGKGNRTADNRSMKLKPRGRALGVLLLLAMLPVVLSPLGLGLRPAAADDTIFFFGHGKGHGVGMCMAGVQARAELGENWTQIIPFYYQGVGFSQTDDSRTIRVLQRNGQIGVWTLHDYLCRLQEEPDSWPAEGLNTCSVAARTYAISCIERNKHAAQGFDICSSGDCCQAFDETTDISRRPHIVASVGNTAGWIITYGGRAITAAYHGCCGGHTANIEDVWGGSAVPYLRGVQDDACINDEDRDWTLSMPWYQFADTLAAYPDSNVGEIYGYGVEALAPDGRVKTVRLDGSSGSKRLTGLEFASRLGLPTNFFDIKIPNFHEYILIQNPGDAPATAKCTFMLPVGDSFEQSYEIAPHSRFTLPVQDVIMNSEVSVRVEGTAPLVAERAMYFNYQGRITGGHASAGVATPSTAWYLAEGYCGGFFDTWILLQNPNTTEALATIKYLTRGGLAAQADYRVPPMARMSVAVDQIPGLETSEVSAVIASDQALVAERAMYFNYAGRDGGSCTAGQPAPSTEWYLAEGYTGGAFDTYLLVMNPQSVASHVIATFMLPGGGTRNLEFDVGPLQRYTVHVDEVEGMASADVSTRVVATSPVVTERAMYFNYGGWTDGHCSAGVPAPLKTWYFAEGCTYQEFATYLLLQNPGDTPARGQAVFMLDSGQQVTLPLEIGAHSRKTVCVNEVAGMAGQSFATLVQTDAAVVAERSMYFRYRGWDGGSNAVGSGATSTVWNFAEGYTGF